MYTVHIEDVSAEVLITYCLGPEIWEKYFLSFPQKYANWDNFKFVSVCIFLREREEIFFTYFGPRHTPLTPTNSSLLPYKYVCAGYLKWDWGIFLSLISCFNQFDFSSSPNMQSAKYHTSVILDGPDLYSPSPYNFS